MRAKMSRLWTPLLAASVVACGLGVSSVANATVILSFAQSVDGPTITATNNIADTASTITGTNIPVTITQYLGGGAPIPAFFDLTLNSVGPTVLSGTQITQVFNGSFSITSLSGDLGTNYLSSVFHDFVFGISGGSSLTLTASEPPGVVAFTSDILDVAQLKLPRAFSFAFADVTPPLAIVGTTLQGFKSSVSGTVSSATSVPEPAGVALFGVGLAALCVLQYRRTTKVQPLNG